MLLRMCLHAFQEFLAVGCKNLNLSSGSTRETRDPQEGEGWRGINNAKG